MITIFFNFFNRLFNTKCKDMTAFTQYIIPIVTAFN